MDELRLSRQDRYYASPESGINGNIEENSRHADVVYPPHQDGDTIIPHSKGAVMNRVLYPDIVRRVVRRRTETAGGRYALLIKNRCPMNQI